MSKQRLVSRLQDSMDGTTIAEQRGDLRHYHPTPSSWHVYIIDSCYVMLWYEKSESHTEIKDFSSSHQAELMKPLQ